MSYPTFCYPAEKDDVTVHVFIHPPTPGMPGGCCSTVREDGIGMFFTQPRDLRCLCGRFTLKDLTPEGPDLTAGRWR